MRLMLCLSHLDRAPRAAEGWSYFKDQQKRDEKSNPDSAKKIERQPKCSPSHPAAAVPKATPAIWPTRKRASSGWRFS